MGIDISRRVVAEFETVRIFAGSDALTRAALGITETQGV
jgi:hypothetical protein